MAEIIKLHLSDEPPPRGKKTKVPNLKGLDLSILDDEALKILSRRTGKKVADLLKDVPACIKLYGEILEEIIRQQLRKRAPQ